MIIKNNIDDKIIELCVFDIDGTLSHYQNMEKLVEESCFLLGLPYQDDYHKKELNAILSAFYGQKQYGTRYFISLISSNLEEAFPVLQEYNISGETFLKTLISLETKYISQDKDAHEVLSYLKNIKKSLTISTNWFLTVQEAKLEALNLRHYFKNLYTIDNYPPKPNKNHFQDLAFVEFFDEQKCVMIGDSQTDMDAQFVGYQTILYDKNESKKDAYYKANAVITELKDIKKLIKKN